MGSLNNGPVMWKHWCPVDRAWLSVGLEEPCNWCGQRCLNVIDEGTEMRKKLADWLRALADKLDPPISTDGAGGPGEEH